MTLVHEKKGAKTKVYIFFAEYILSLKPFVCRNISLKNRMVHKLQNYKDMFTLYGPIGVILGIFFLFLCVNNVHRFVGPASSRYDVATSIGTIKIVIYFDTRGDVYFCNEEPSSRDCFFFSPSPSMI